MKYSQLLGKTLRKSPKQVKSKGYALLHRGGFVRPLARGLYSYLPLGMKVIENIKKVIREELGALNGQEIQIPMVNPYGIWKRGGRLELLAKEIVRFKDRDGRNLVLAPSHEEAMIEIARTTIKSYRDLPIFVYEFQDMFRDEKKTGYGLVRTKEFLMKDAYSFHRSYTNLNNFFPKVYAAYQRIFNRLRVETITAEAGVGYIGGEKSYEFLAPSGYGDDVVIQCTNCGYASNREVAVGIKEYSSEVPRTLEVVATPGCATMDDLAACLELPKAKLTKAMVYKTSAGYVMALIRGDYEVSLEKLARCLGRPVLRKASAAELDANGLLPGYLSPINLDAAMKVVVDETVSNSSNLVVGTNQEGSHYLNANFGRDYESEHVADISRIKKDNYCIQCGHILSEIHAMELGNIFKLGQFYTRKMELAVNDENGESIYPYMGSYGIGIGRLMVAIVEANHDSRGILWPANLAPYKGFLMGIGRAFRVRQTVEQIHDDFIDDVLLDDREESPGVKFKDADLLGLPLRIVVSAKNLQNGKVEFHDRKTDDTWLVSTDKIDDVLKTERQ
jgi:prolyl-tRNA synthetase